VVRSSRSSKTIGTWLNLAFSLAVAEDIFPVSNLYLRSGLSVSSPCVFHRGSLSFAGIRRMKSYFRTLPSRFLYLIFAVAGVFLSFRYSYYAGSINAP
jgi:hypothetical protein